jgi:hypothetical protein
MSYIKSMDGRPTGGHLAAKNLAFALTTGPPFFCYAKEERVSDTIQTTNDAAHGAKNAADDAVPKAKAESAKK